MKSKIHQAQPHKLSIRGIEAMTLVSDQHFPRHSHDQFGIGVIDAGAHRSWSAVGTVTASAGDVIMVNPGEIHDGVPVSGQARRWRMTYLDPKLLMRDAEHEFTGEIEIVRPVARDAELARSFQRLFASLTSSHADSLAIEENLLSTTTRLLKCHSTARQRPESASPCVAKAIARLRAAQDEPVTLAELGALTGISRYKLLRSFARELGITPHGYLLQHRLQSARRLLAAGCEPVYAAMQSGFADQSHLTRVFVRYLGVTPARYRAAVS